MHEAVPPTNSGAPIPYTEFVAIVAFLLALNAAAIDIVLPALGPITQSFSITDGNLRQLVVASYVVSFGISQLIYGPLADRFGRRPVLFWGLAIYTLGSVGAIFAFGFSALIVARTIQGLGAGAIRVMAIAVVRDCYSGREMARIMSLAMMVFMAIPVLAPLLGQGVLMIAHWRWILTLVTAFGLIMIVWTRTRLPETLASESRRPLSAAKIFDAFRIVASNPISRGYGISLALVFGCLFAYLNSAQQIYQEIYGLGSLFPIAFSTGAIVVAISAFINARLVRKLGMRRLSHWALCLFTSANFILYALTLAGGGAISFTAFFVLNIASFCFFGIIAANFNAIAMEPLGAVAGTGSSVLGFLQTFFGGLIGAIIGLSFDGTLQPMALGFALMSIISIGAVAVSDPDNLFGKRDLPESA